MNALYLNILLRTQRKIDTEKAWKPHFPKLKKLTATEARDITPDQLKVEKNPRVVACYISHSRAFEQAQKNKGFTLILEDDCRPCEDYKTRWETFEQETKKVKWDILLLGHWPLPHKHLLVPIDSPSEARPIAPHLYTAIRGIIGCHAYIIHPDFYAQYQKILDMGFNNMDEVFKWVQQNYTMLCFLPTFCYQAGNESDTGGDGIVTNSEQGTMLYFANTISEWVEREKEKEVVKS